MWVLWYLQSYVSLFDFSYKICMFNHRKRWREHLFLILLLLLSYSLAITLIRLTITKRFRFVWFSFGFFRFAFCSMLRQRYMLADDACMYLCNTFDINIFKFTLKIYSYIKWNAHELCCPRPSRPVYSAWWRGEQVIVAGDRDDVWGSERGVWTYVYCGRYYYFLQLLQRGIQSRKFQFAAR